MTNREPQPPGRRAVFALLVLPLIVFAVIAGWIFWAETHPDLERELRVTAQAQLEAWLPEVVSPEPGRIGFTPASEEHSGNGVEVILIHGLDEPGGIWDEMASAMADAGLVAWEFRYPNDQAIAQSADLLAAQWPRLESAEVYLVGHSMGGLVIRDFVSRYRHPVSQSPAVSGPAVGGVVMIGTPNQGSEWARLRAWLEIREWLADLPEGRASLFSGLRDGTGAAKLDLRPDSGFLTDLNSRTWPAEVPVLILGGLLTEPTEDMMDGLQRIADDLGMDDAQPLVEKWWRDAGQGIGDGAVPVESLAFEGGPAPILLPASHRGLVLTLPFSEQAPPAIEPTINQILDWQAAN
ncbi:MAG: alpha/beta fold hydrolase [Wenzhouxiangella sp.]|nr:alpha/beta fold hydrolase [Wenzhouxiangella sp.]